MTRDPFHCAPKIEAGCRMPSGNTIEHQDRVRRNDAEAGSRALLNALHRYFLKGGRG